MTEIYENSYNAALMGGTPYYDDFDPDKKFLKVLFKPGLPLQAREVSQIQTLLQNQIERFGNHTFKNGSVVLGGAVTASTGFFVRLNEVLPTATLNNLVGQKIRHTDDNNLNTDAVVVGVLEQSTLTNDNYQVLIVNYLTIGRFEAGNSISTFGLGNIGVEVSVLSENETTASSGSIETFVTVEEGIFYVDGYFVKSSPQSVPAFRSDSTTQQRVFTETNTSIGFNSEKTVVTVDTDPSLRDPSFGFFNFNAPGADRYKINLKLENRGLTGEANAAVDAYDVVGTENFFELVRVIDGKITKSIKYPEYAELEKTLARRTFDESGNYVVNAFEIEVGSHEDIVGTVDTSKYAIKLSPGKAYVSGYEYESIAPTTITVDRSSEVQLAQATYSLNTPSFFGIKGTLTQFENSGAGITMNGEVSSSVADFITSGRKVSLLDGSDNEIGTCIITGFAIDRLAILEDTSPDTDTPARVYFTQRSMLAGQSDNAIKKIRFIDASGNTDFELSVNFSVGNQDVLTEKSSTKIAKLSSAINAITDPVRFTSFKPFRETADSDGVVNISTTNSDEDFLGQIGTESNGAVIEPLAMINLGGSDNTLCLLRPRSVPVIDNDVSQISLDFGSAAASKNLFVFCPMVFESRNSIRIKTVSGDISESFTADNDGKVDLGVSDVFKIESVVVDGVDGDVKENFIFDDGQTDFAYNFSKLTAISTKVDEYRNKSVAVIYKRFIHSGEGPFTAQSYAAVDADDIPEVTLSILGNARLTDCVDFRPIQTSTTTYDSGTSEASQTPFSGDVFNSFVSFSQFLPRIDSVVLTADRVLRVVKGLPSIDPTPPTIPFGDLELYRIRVNQQSSVESNQDVISIENDRFTMSDINSLSERQNSDFLLNYRRGLSQTITARANALTPDSVVAEVDVYVDDLIGQSSTFLNPNADSVGAQHNTSVDVTRGRVYPAFKTKVVEVINLSTPAGATLTSDNIVMADFTSAPYVTQNRRSNQSGRDGNNVLTRANPFGVTNYLGNMSLGTYTAKYWSETTKPKLVSNVAGEMNAYEFAVTAYDSNGRRNGFGTLFRDYETLWYGIESRDIEFFDNDPKSITYKNPRRSISIARLLADKPKRKVGNKIIDVSVIPYIDDFTLSGTLTGMKPGATLNVFFDGERVSETGSPITVGTTGGATFSYAIPRDTYFSGKKLVRVTDNVDGAISTAETSADAFFYAQGLLDTQLYGKSLPRPLEIRRKSANIDAPADDIYNNNFVQTSTSIAAGVDPVSQTFTIDAESYPDGLFLSQVALWFQTADVNVTLRVHPTQNGNPLLGTVLPFATVNRQTVACDLTLGNAVGNDLIELPNDNQTLFTFSTPVFLPPGEYAISLASNDSDARLYTYDESGGSSPIKPNVFNNYFQPQNTGEIVPLSEKYFCARLDRAAFGSDNPTPVFSCQGTGTDDFDAVFVSNIPQSTSSLEPTYSLVYDTQNGINVNTNFNTTTQFSRRASVDTGTLTVNLSSDGRTSSVVDLQKLSVLLTKFDINDTGTGSETSNDSASSNKFRYYSKVVESDNLNDGLVVLLDGKFTDDVNVYARFASGPTNLFDEDFVEVPFQIPEGGNQSKSLLSSLAFGVNTQPYSRYQFKVVIRKDETAGGASPFLTGIGAAPLRSSNLVVQGGGGLATSPIPTGTILPFGSTSVPPGFKLCDGSPLNRNNFEDLFLEIGYSYGGAGDEFNLPNFQGRVPVGVGDSPAGTQRSIGQVGGSEVAPGGQQITVTVPSTGSNTSTGTSTALRRINEPDSNIDTTSITNVTAEAKDSGGGDSTTNMPPFVVVNYIIKT
jgi:microcystin-dependent protein|tara:strand:+ start:4696 stop:10125 length:5430 start_codon:yes stop_codon:yes gene_type:complete